MRAVLVILVAVFVAGCAKPKIDSNIYPPPRTVVIDDFPDMRHTATIGPLTLVWPHNIFSNYTNHFFAPKKASANTSDWTSAYQPEVPNYGGFDSAAVAAAPTTSVASGVAAGAVAGLIQGFAENTQRRAADFPNLVTQAMPNVDMRVEFKNALKKSLTDRGIEVRFASETREHFPRLRWPAIDPNGRQVQPGNLLSSPPVEADLLVQVAPIAVYSASGPLNAYTRKVTVGLALFDGRTRAFLGWQAFKYESSDRTYEYTTYDGMVSDIEKASPALLSALMSLVPDVASAIAGKGVNREGNR